MQQFSRIVNSRKFSGKKYSDGQLVVKLNLTIKQEFTTLRAVKISKRTLFIEFDNDFIIRSEKFRSMIERVVSDYPESVKEVRLLRKWN
jgi:hypothetical protein